MSEAEHDPEAADAITAPVAVVADALGHRTRWRVVDMVATAGIALRVADLATWLAGEDADYGAFRERLHEHLRILDDAGAVAYDMDEERVGPTPETAVFVDVLEDIHARTEVTVDE